VEAAIANYASKPPMSAFHPDALRGYVEGGTEPIADGVRLTCRPEWEAATFRMAGGSPGWDAMPSIDIPVTVVRGAAEPGGYGPAAFAEAAASRLPRGRLLDRPDLDHFGPFTHPDDLAAEITTWVAGA
jgi:pimeloyl-ACP methyl ester carboxylesterase